MSNSSLSAVTPNPIAVLKKLVVGIREQVYFMQGLESTIIFLIQEKEAIINRQNDPMHKQSKHDNTVKAATLRPNCQQEPMETQHNNAKDKRQYSPMREQMHS